MNERSYVRQQPLWLQLLKIRRERAAWEVAARAAQTWQERNEFNGYALRAQPGQGVTQ